MTYTSLKAANAAVAAFTAANGLERADGHKYFARVEARDGGRYAAVYSEKIPTKHPEVKSELTKIMVASWHIQIPAELWAFVGEEMSRETAEAIRAIVEPLLPKRWSFTKSWFILGRMKIYRAGRQEVFTRFCPKVK